MSTQTKKELTITRILDAPRELVFEAWTDAKHVAKWWGPDGFTNPVCEVDPRPGGAIRIDMKGPDEIIYPMTATFQEFIKPSKLVMKSSALNNKGEAILEVINTITFTELNDKTKLTIHASVIKATDEAIPYIAGMDEGWRQMVDRLEGFVTASINRSHQRM